MYELTKQLERKVVIQNEIMIHLSFPKPITNNQKPYSDEVWRKKELKHKLDKMFFLTLSSMKSSYQKNEIEPLR
jgi:hypothetical protein